MSNSIRIFSPKKRLLMLMVVILLLSLAVNIQTIRTFPSWFDEAFLANISYNFFSHSRFMLDIIPGYYQGEVLFYGPIYFVLQAWLIGLFGLDAFVFRSPALLSAYLVGLVLAGLLRKQGLSGRWVIVFALILLVDVSFNRNAVSGRMDMVAVLAVVLALYLAAQPFTARRGDVIRSAFVGFLCAIAFLTTPRALFLTPVVAVVMACSLWSISQATPRLTCWGFFAAAVLSFLIPVLGWISHVGGLSTYYQQYVGSNVVMQHVAPSLLRSSYDNVAIVMMLGFAMLKWRAVLVNPLLLGLLASYLSFSLFVREVGPYAGMLMPFVLCALVIILQEVHHRLVRRGAVACLLFPGLFLLGARGVDIVLNNDCRNISEVSRVIAQFVGENERVVAPFKYYFLLEREQRELQTWDYSRVPRDSLLASATVVVDRAAEEAAFGVLGLAPVAMMSCEVIRVFPLPDTFYRRSTFDEVIFRRLY